jgi:hypothetical protein
VPLTVAWGTGELEEFQRQSREFVEVSCTGLARIARLHGLFVFLAENPNISYVA